MSESWWPRDNPTWPKWPPHRAGRSRPSSPRRFHCPAGGKILRARTAPAGQVHFGLSPATAPALHSNPVGSLAIHTWLLCQWHTGSPKIPEELLSENKYLEENAKKRQQRLKTLTSTTQPDTSQRCAEWHSKNPLGDPGEDRNQLVQKMQSHQLSSEDTSGGTKPPTSHRSYLLIR